MYPAARFAGTISLQTGATRPRSQRLHDGVGSTTGSDGMFTAAKSRLLGAMATPATLRFPPPRPPPRGTPAG